MGVHDRGRGQEERALAAKREVLGATALDALDPPPVPQVDRMDAKERELVEGLKAVQARTSPSAAQWAKQTDRATRSNRQGPRRTSLTRPRSYARPSSKREQWRLRSQSAVPAW